jgi:hypothetical protein
MRLVPPEAPETLPGTNLALVAARGKGQAPPPPQAVNSTELFGELEHVRAPLPPHALHCPAAAARAARERGRRSARCAAALSSGRP